jgi:hypothetical protein
MSRSTRARYRGTRAVRECRRGNASPHRAGAFLSGRCLGTVDRVVLRRALRLTADDAQVVAQAQEWSERDPPPDIFAIPADAVDRMRTVAATAGLGIPIYREVHLALDRSPDNLRWVTTALVAPAGPFRYLSTAPALGFLTALVPACKQASVPLDSIIVRAHADTVYATTKVVVAFVKNMTELGLTQLRTDTVMLERFAEQFAPFEIWLDDHTEAQHGRTLETTFSAAVVVLDPQSSLWSE